MFTKYNHFAKDLDAAFKAARDEYAAAYNAVEQARKAMQDAGPDALKRQIATLQLQDYFGFADRYDGNPTMLKLIGHYAKEAADSTDDRKDRVALTVLAQDCAKGTGKTLKAWDSMMTAANYCSGRGGNGNRRTTPGVTLSMGEWWEQLSGEIIENF